jgi:hypothetical protein
VFPPKAVEAGAPKALGVPPKGVLVAAPPNGLVDAGVVLPNAGLLAPNNPPPVLEDAPKGDDVAAGVEPNPPKPVEPVVAVPPPNKLLPAVVVVVPNPDGLAPKALFVVVPKPVKVEC